MLGISPVVSVYKGPTDTQLFEQMVTKALETGHDGPVASTCALIAMGYDTEAALILAFEQGPLSCDAEIIPWLLEQCTGTNPADPVAAWAVDDNGKYTLLRPLTYP